MNCADDNLIASYSEMMRGLSVDVRARIAAHLSEAPRQSEEQTNRDFFAALGTWAGDGMTAEEQVNELRMARRFQRKDLDF